MVTAGETDNTSPVQIAASMMICTGQFDCSFIGIAARQGKHTAIALGELIQTISQFVTGLIDTQRSYRTYVGFGNLGFGVFETLSDSIQESWIIKTQHKTSNVQQWINHGLTIDHLSVLPVRWRLQQDLLFARNQTLVVVVFNHRSMYRCIT